MPFDVLPLGTAIEGPVLIEPRIFGDDRGFLLETYRRDAFLALGIEEEFVQDNHSRSRRGVIRGMHFQRRHGQAKIVRVVRGRVFDVAVDLRAGSPTEGRWCAARLDDRKMHMMYVPAGLAHGFLALSDEVELVYKCAAYYDAADEGGLRWDDPDVGIEWPLEEVGSPIVSSKDAGLPRLSELEFRLEGVAR